MGSITILKRKFLLVLTEKIGQMKKNITLNQLPDYGLPFRGHILVENNGWFNDTGNDKNNNGWKEFLHSQTDSSCQMRSMYLAIKAFCPKLVKITCRM